MGLFNLKLGNKSTEKAIGVVGDVVKGVSKGLDVMVFTNEERAELNFKIGDQVTKFVEMTLNENTARSKTRRYIAVLFVYLFAALLIAAAIFWKFDKDYSDFLLALAKEQSTIVMTIVVFYFGYYGFQKVIGDRAKKKK